MLFRSSAPKLLLIIIILIAQALQGCATTGTSTPGDPDDPWKGLNRKVFKFNEGVDRHVMKPLARAYKKATPKFVERRIDSFFSNLDDVVVMVNNFLQGKIGRSASDFGRIITNTTIGLYGFFDVASHFGLKKHNEDFGQTLGRWGAGTGPYLVLPFLGPSTVRDTAGIPIDWYFDPLVNVSDRETRWILLGIKAITIRANLLSTEEVIDELAYDRYEFIKRAYLDRREYLVRDGKVDQEEADADLLDELEEIEGSQESEPTD